MCVVFRGGVETRNHICMKMSQTRSSQISFSLLHKMEFQQFLRCIEFGEGTWRNSQREVSFTCESVQLLLLNSLPCQQPRDVHVIVLVMADAFYYGI